MTNPDAHAPNKTPKVLIGCPTADYKEYCLSEYIEGIKQLTYPAASRRLVIVDNSADTRYFRKIEALGAQVVHAIKDAHAPSAMARIVHSRNMLIDYAIQNGYDYFFSLEQDVIPPKDAIERLLAHEKDAVSGIYFKPWSHAQGSQQAVIPLIWGYFSAADIAFAKRNIARIESVNPEMAKLLRSTEDVNALATILKKPISYDAIKGKGLMRIKAAGIGCMMIRTSVLERIRFRENPEGFDDMTFCQDLEREGIPLYADPSVVCEHLVQQDQWRKVGRVI